MDTARKSNDEQLIGLIADEKVCVGFLLAGIGECNKNGQMNFLVVDETTNLSTIEEFFKDTCSRTDIALLLIQEDIAKKISRTMNYRQGQFPIILEIPSRDKIFATQWPGIELLIGNQNG